ncbi:DUF3800 domain-containing protein [uncultured Methanobrevibacter sp.]|uniref:DUF3800 domain-containing protein n=1 Tax=uncultured Methanobrevibacter sp. TaxID=253161 RepID=UPI00262D5DFF|nr:DUF3800 domain-containing protein [uncultured Methanobrevibacter sp.]
MNYIFIDESGDLGFKTSSSHYFILVAILVSNPKKLDNLVKNTYRKYKRRIYKSNELKATKTPNDINMDIIVKLNKIDNKVFAIVFEKSNIYKLDFQNDINILYDILASKLANLIEINDKTVIIVDKNKNQIQIKNFNEVFKKNLNNLKNHPISFIHANSINYKGLQIADLLSWSIYQKYENKNDAFEKLIENKSVKKVYED